MCSETCADRTPSAPGRRLRRLVSTGAALALVVGALLAAAAPQFYPDDPIERDNDTAIDASKAREIEDSDYYDFVENSFFSRGERKNTPAVNANTLGEVPDST